MNDRINLVSVIVLALLAVGALVENAIATIATGKESVLAHDLALVTAGAVAGYLSQNRTTPPGVK